MAAKQACLRPALALACSLAVAAAGPAVAQSSPKRKPPPENPWTQLFHRLTSEPAASKKPAKKGSQAATAKGAKGSPGEARTPIPEPRPAPASAEVPPTPTAAPSGTADVQPAPAPPVAPTPAQPVPATTAQPATTAATPSRTTSGRNGAPTADRLPTTTPGAPATPAALTPPAPAPPQRARLLAAEPVRMAKDAWAPQTRAAMFAAEPALTAIVFPALGSRLAAVGAIELRSPAGATPPGASPAARAATGSPGVPLPRPAPAEQDMKVASLPTPEPPEPESACVNLLAAGVESTPAEALAGDGDCGARRPVKVTAFQTGEGRVTLDPPAVMRCGMARAVSQWLKENVAPTAKAKLGSELRSVRNASSYVCRPRNGVAGGKMSEHGRANALDISAFVLANGKVVTIGAEGSEELTAFAAEVRTAACTYLHTVLGPGSDASHSDHLHVDMAQRGKNGDSRFCQ